MRSTLAVLCTTILLSWAAAGPAADGPAVKRGKKLFLDTDDLLYPSCAHCHSLQPEAEEKKADETKTAVTLYGAAIREGWRNMKTYRDVGEAAQYCAKTFQDKKKGLSAAERSDLIAFLKTHVPKDKASLPRRKVQRRPKLLERLAGGDATAGQKLFARYCAQCHNEGEDSISFVLKPGKKRKEFIVRKVRGYNAKRKFKPSQMGYFTNDRLSDEDLRHILAYLGK